MTEIRNFPSPGQAALEAARMMAEALRAAVTARGLGSLALSGGNSPLALFAALAQESLPWKAIHLFQADERVAPAGSEQRNWTALKAGLLAHVDIPAANIHSMPVDGSANTGDLSHAAAAYRDC
ncbi:MAG: 6-phosphogluconolactonase, partial [Lysobacterales bacterium]